MITCNICYDNGSSKKFIICKRCNQSMCSNCYVRVNKCPFCRQKPKRKDIENNLDIFLHSMSVVELQRFCRNNYVYDFSIYYVQSGYNLKKVCKKDLIQFVKNNYEDFY